MLETIEFTNPNIVGVRVVGKITEDSATPFIDKLQTKLKQPDKLRMYIELDEMNGFSPEVAMQELKFKSSIDSYAKFEKMAFISDSNWVGAIAFMADLFPAVDAKEFDASDKEAAKQWIMN